MNIIYPDYNNSIANLANSILKKWGLPANGGTLKLLDHCLGKTIRMWWLFYLMAFIASHAGLTKDEMIIPLIIVEKE
ncbi:MAG: hypothetical protein ACOYI1_01210 [Caldicoprobacteraceae bacterium]|jgi:hypothetical protein